jgi:hypothetical protein
LLPPRKPGFGASRPSLRGIVIWRHEAGPNATQRINAGIEFTPICGNAVRVGRLEFVAAFP